MTTQPLFFTAPRPFFPPPLSLPSLPLINSHAPDINQYIRFTSPKRSPNPKPPTSLSPPSPQSISTHAHPPSPSPHRNRALSARHIPPPLPSPRTRTYPEARDIPGSASSVYPQSHPSACAIWGVVSADSRSAIHDKSQPPPGPLPYLAPLTSPRPHQTHLSTTTTPLPPPLSSLHPLEQRDSTSHNHPLIYNTPPTRDLTPPTVPPLPPKQSPFTIHHHHPPPPTSQPSPPSKAATPYSHPHQ